MFDIDKPVRCPLCPAATIAVSRVYEARQARQCRAGHNFAVSFEINGDVVSISPQCKPGEILGSMIHQPTTSHLRGAHRKETIMQTTNTGDGKTLTAIERALAAAKARKAAKAAAHGEDSGTLTPAAPPPKVARPKTEVKPVKEKPSDETRAAAKAQRDAERAQRRAAKTEREAADRAAKDARKAAREEKKAAKAAAKSSGKTPAHMKKVDRARSKCPSMLEPTTRLFDEAATNLSIGQIAALAQHLLVQARALQTQRAMSSPALPLGARVRVTDGEARYIGLEGEVVHSQKLRAKIKVEGRDKLVYIYTGEAEVVSQ